MVYSHQHMKIDGIRITGKELYLSPFVTSCAKNILSVRNDCHIHFLRMLTERDNFVQK